MQAPDYKVCPENYRLKSMDFKVTYVMRRGARIYYEQHGDHDVMSLDFNSIPACVLYLNLQEVEFEDVSNVIERANKSKTRTNMPFEYTNEFRNQVQRVEHLEGEIRSLTEQKQELKTQFQRLNEQYKLEKMKFESLNSYMIRKEEERKKQVELTERLEEELEISKKRAEKHFDVIVERNTQIKKLNDKNIQLAIQVRELHRTIDQQKQEMDTQRRQIQTMEEDNKRLQDLATVWNRARSQRRD